MTAFHSGTVLGQYTLLERIGQGGMADVHLARSEGAAGFQKLVVLKILRPSLLKDRDFCRMFAQEARVCARLDHPNIVRTYDVGNDGGVLYLAMEFLEGETLARVLSRVWREGCRPDGAPATLPVAARVRVVMDLLAGLEHAHGLTDFDGKPLGVVHRDVSPQNVFVGFSGHSKVLDFGIAKVSASSLATELGVLKGKFRYMSPEQFAGAPVDRRADVYAAGIVLWECLAGRRLWGDLDLPEISERARRGVIPRLASEGVLGVPAALEDVCMRALAGDPADRFPTASAMASALEDAARELGHARHGAVATSMRELFPDTEARLRAFHLASHEAPPRAPMRSFSLTPLAMTVPSGELDAVPDDDATVVDASPLEGQVAPRVATDLVPDSTGSDLFDRPGIFAERFRPLDVLLAEETMELSTADLFVLSPTGAKRDGGPSGFASITRPPKLPAPRRSRTSRSAAAMWTALAVATSVVALVASGRAPMVTRRAPVAAKACAASVVAVARATRVATTPRPSTALPELVVREGADGPVTSAE